MRAMKWHMHPEGKMNVDRARQKRKHAKRESHQKADQVKIGPGHRTPPQLQFCYWGPTTRRGTRSGITWRGLLRKSASRCPGRRMSAALLRIGPQHFGQAVSQVRSPQNFCKQQ